nr:hypothetical protein [Kistimonas asteriae]
MSFMHKMCSVLFLLVAISYQAHSAQLTNHMKEASVLTAQAFEQARPNVLLCVIPSSSESGNTSDVIGKVIPAGDGGSYVCESTALAGDVSSGAQVSKEFKWLDIGHDQLASWLISFASLEKNESGAVYFALRCSEHRPDHAPAICVQSTQGKGFEFGYEGGGDNGSKSCAPHEGALYASPYFHAAATAFSSCTGDTFHPECHRCNGGGCGAFECSAFTSWDKCPSGSHLCGYEHCVANFCPMRPICQWDK